MQKEKEMIIDYFNTWQTIATAPEIIRQVCGEHGLKYGTPECMRLVPALLELVIERKIQVNGQYYAKGW